MLLVVKAGATGHSITINGHDHSVHNTVSDTTPSRFCTTGGITNFSPYIGCNFLGEDKIEMALGDMVVYDSMLDSENTDEMEGYLLHKWGQKLMPATHPYYTSEPDCVDEEECSTELCYSAIKIKDADGNYVGDTTSTSTSVTIPIVYRSSEKVYGYQFKISGLAPVGGGITPGTYANGVASGNWTFTFTDPLGQGFENYAVVDNENNVWVVGYLWDSGRGNLIPEYTKFSGFNELYQDLCTITITKTSSISGTVPSAANIFVETLPNNVDDTTEYSHPIISTYPSSEEENQKPTSAHWTGNISDVAGDTSVSIADARALVSHCIRENGPQLYRGNPTEYQYFERMDGFLYTVPAPS
jgi:hypothetical protein